MCLFLKKNQNAPRPSEHPPVRGGKMSKRLGGIIGCKYKTSSWHLNGFPYGCLKKNQNAPRPSEHPPVMGEKMSKRLGGIKGCKYVVVFFTLTDRASTIPSNISGCQSGTWSQRGTKVNGSHHGDNPLLRPTEIKIATQSYATLQAMAPTNNKTMKYRGPWWWRP